LRESAIEIIPKIAVGTMEMRMGSIEFSISRNTNFFSWFLLLSHFVRKRTHGFTAIPSAVFFY
jgi:hypothetical protein